MVSAAQTAVRSIQKGKPLAALAGAIIGGTLGTGIGVLMPELRAFGALLGAIVGASLAAVAFKRPPAVLGRKDAGSRTQPGAVLQAWAFADGDFQSMTALLEHALYVVREDSAPWDVVLEKLARGEAPGISGAALIYLKQIERVEIRTAEATEIQVVYTLDGRPRRRGIDFQTIFDRDELLALMEHYFGKQFRREQQPMEVERAIRAPVISAVIVATIFGGAALLSAYWTARPPPPPRGQIEPDPLVRTLISAGPGSVLGVGAVLAMPILVWLIWRVLRPAQIEVLLAPDEVVGRNRSP